MGLFFASETIFSKKSSAITCTVKINVFHSRTDHNELCSDMLWDPVRLWNFSRTDSDTAALEDDIFFYAKKNLAVVNVYIKDPVVTRILRDQKIPIIAFVANTGGLLGLCMGFSLVSVFEVLYHLLGAAHVWWKKRTREGARRLVASTAGVAQGTAGVAQQQQQQGEGLLTAEGSSSNNGRVPCAVNPVSSVVVVEAGDHESDEGEQQNGGVL